MRVTARTAGWDRHRGLDGARDRCCAVAVVSNSPGDRDEAHCEHNYGGPGDFGHYRPTVRDCGEGPASFHRCRNSRPRVQVRPSAPRLRAPFPETDRGCPNQSGSRRARRFRSPGCSLLTRPATRSRGGPTSDSLRGTDAGGPRNDIGPALSGLRTVLGGIATTPEPSHPPDRRGLARRRALLTLLFRQNPPRMGWPTTRTAASSPPTRYRVARMCGCAGASGAGQSQARGVAYGSPRKVALSADLPGRATGTAASSRGPDLQKTGRRGSIRGPRSR